MSSIAPPPRRLRLVRGSHIVLNDAGAHRKPTPTPCRTRRTASIFVMPWLDRRFLIVGTTEVPQEGDPGAAACSLQEQAYLLDAYNRYFARPGGPVSDTDVVLSFVRRARAYRTTAAKKPSRLSRRPALASIANGTGGFVTLYGGKLTTHRAFAETVLDALRDLGARMGGPWTKDVPLYGGCETRAGASLPRRARTHKPLA